MKLNFSAVGMGIVGTLLAFVPFQTQALYMGETTLKCTTGYVIVDGISYSSRACWTETNYSYVVGSGSLTDPLDYLDGIGGWWDRFTSAKIGNFPNDIPATSYSPATTRWSHAVKDAAQWITLHPNKSLRTQSVTVTYDNGGTETWNLTHMSDTLSVEPVAGSLRHP